MTFIEQLPEIWQKHWRSSGFDEPSLIQEKSFTLLKNQENVLGISPTGSGKTLAYLLPLLLNVEKETGSQLLILASSQELAMQISKVTQEWGSLIQLRTQSLIGGANVSRQIDKLKKKPEVLVGTPGRVLELIKAKKIKSHLLKTIVMDEVDQLFHESELNLTKQILDSSSTKYQVVFYSATADRVIEEAEKLADKLSVVDVSTEDRSAGQVHHYFMRLSPRKKIDYLRSLSYTTNFRSMVFFNQVSELGAAEEKMIYQQIPVVGLASDQNKSLRKLAIDQFSTKRVNVLLTTDIGARGLDFKEVPYVVNVEVPLSEESYIHRAGRVGRMGADGVVLTFINDATKRDYQRLMKKICYETKEVFLYDGELHLERKEKSEASQVETTPKKAISKQPKKTIETPEKQEKPIEVIKEKAPKKKKRTKKSKNKGARRKG
ncbi:DEAD/DEAH box helicase [Enterococcus rivorum]|uniref:RNA helicase n=1 Tax=Enterococcus rivorum TaxID=762845 RepID=A0A1E5KVC6_9ENTE|nr:DEAD/DEAH box helicase [Enterococcus rivorum]MBP2098379.1 superfamily II DNA/RNA helicase [Enterococcus rivorum]OEH81834.1 RNA helicase [Enterococcus rivorum]